MPSLPTAAILSVGDELLSGDVVDTNASWLDAQLADRGWRVAEHRVVPDDVERIAAALAELSERAARIVITGGLGPTDDDLTIAAVAAAAGVSLVHHEPTWARIRGYFEQRGRRVLDGHRRQAQLPQGARVIDNPLGSAPGLELRVGGAEVLVLPGVPTEMRALFERAAASWPPGPAPVVRRVLRTVGLGESDLEARVAPTRARHAAIRFGFRSVGLVQDLRLYGDDVAAVEAAEQALVAELGPLVFGRDDEPLSGAVGRALKAQAATVATAESCTGGLLGAAFTEVPGSSAYYLGGIVAYANEVKVQALGVDPSCLADHGAVSEPVARALADGVRERLGATYGLSTTGVAGPGGGTPDKPVGLVWIGLSGPDGTRAKELRLHGDRDIIRRRTVQFALALLYATLVRGTGSGPRTGPEPSSGSGAP